MTDFIKELKSQINIVDVVGEYVRLKKAGSNHMGLCPFHAERTPSFSVAERKGIFHCFGCQKGGDAITFIQEVQNISFHEAVRFLAAKYGIKVPSEFASKSSGVQTKEKEDRLAVYYKLNRFVAQFYHEKLFTAQGKQALEYLKGRGISENTMRNAYIGYAPDGWSELYDFLASKKAPLSIAEELGLIRKKSNATGEAGQRQHYDLFRSRVMFPVVDKNGRVIAFGGRALKKNDGTDDGPKYLNSPESAIYKKGDQFFGFFSAQKEIRAEDFCVIVEGFMDCLSLQQAGLGYTIATLGTALTDRQVTFLKRYTKNIVILFDGDEAGQQAQQKAMETFLKAGVVVRGVTLPDGLDPDEYVQKLGPETLIEKVKSAPYILDQKILEMASQAGLHTESRSRAVDQILPWLNQIESETAKLVRIQEIASLFDLNFESLERKIIKKTVKNTPQFAIGRPIVKPPRKPITDTHLNTVDLLDAAFLEKIVCYPLQSAEVFEEAGVRESILLGLEAQETSLMAQKLMEKKEGSFTSDVLEWTPSPPIKVVLSRALLLAETAAEQLRSPESSNEKLQEVYQELKDLKTKLVRRGLEKRRDALRAVLLKTEALGQSTELSKLMNEYHELAMNLNNKGDVNL